MQPVRNRSAALHSERPDAFGVAGLGPVGPNCAENFPLDRFDDEDVQESLYYVTSGNIVVR